MPAVSVLPTSRLIDLLKTLAVDARVAATAETEDNQPGCFQEAILDRVVSIWGIPSEDAWPREGLLAVERLEAELVQATGRPARHLPDEVALDVALRAVWAVPAEHRWPALAELLLGSEVTVAQAWRALRARHPQDAAILLTWGANPPADAGASFVEPPCDCEVVEGGAPRVLARQPFSEKISEAAYREDSKSASGGVG